MSRNAFTLIELMVAIFLMLLVMIGVNSVFTTTSATVSAGQAQSAMVRDARAMQAVFARDFGTMYSDNAPLIIRSEQLFQFASRKDMQADADGNVQTIDLNGNGNETDSGETINGAIYGTRSHRQDRVSFFVQESLRRQTGNKGFFASNMAAREAWIWFGHLRLSNDSGSFFLDPPTNNSPALPGNGTIATNPNDFFANQWALGRWATLLVKPDGTGNIYDRTGGTTQDFISRNTSSSSSVAPLDAVTTSTVLHDSTAYTLEDSRYDLAGTTISDFKTIVTTAISNGNANWYTDMMGGPASRFRGSAFVPRPLDSKGMAQLTPIMASGVSQFMVEYAGDFVAQNSGGTVTACYFDPTNPNNLNPNGRDGDIDYITPTSGNMAGQRMIRWYGMPRSTSGSTTITLTNGDVCPLRDTVQTVAAYAGQNAPIERSGSGGNNVLTAGASADYAGAMTGNTGYYYICAWSPTDTVRPKLIRIVFTLEDLNGRVPGGQTFEYVYALP